MAALALATTAPCAIAQTSGTWTSTTSGSWGNSANWSGGAIADGTGVVANFSTLDISGVVTVTLDTPRTSGTLLFGDTTPSGATGWALTSSTLTLAVASGAPTISVTGLDNLTAFNSRAATISSVIAGSSGLTKTGSSALVLSGVNTYSGATTVSGGFLVLNNASALGNSSSVTVAGGGALAIGNGITIGAGKSLTNSSGGLGSYGGITAISGGTGTWAGSVTLGSSGNRIGYEQNSVLVLSGSIGGSQPFLISGLDVSGSRTSIDTRYAVLVSATNNAYSGQTQVGRGVLKIGANNALPTTTTLDIRTSALNGTDAAGFDLNGFNQTVGVLASSGISAGSGSVTANGSAFLTNSSATTGTFTANQAVSGTFYGMITGNLAFTKSGAGNLTLTPTLVPSATTGTTGTSTFSGDTFVSAGTLTLGNANALFGSTFDTASTGTLSLGTLSAATFGGLKGTGTFALTNSGSAFTLSVGGNGASGAFAGTVNGLGGLTKVGSGTFTMSGSSGYAGVTTLAGGAFALGGANAIPASGTITFSGGALQYTANNTTEYTSRIANSGSAVAIDTNGQNVTFTGGLNATNTGGLTKLGTGTLTLSASNALTGAVTLGGGVLALGDANALPASGNVRFTGGTLQYSASNTADLASRIASSTSAIAIDTNNQSVTWAGNLASTNTGGLSKTGAGTLTLSGSNAFTGAVSVTGGTLAIGGPNAFPQTGVTGVSLNGGTLQGSGSVSPSNIPAVTTITLGASGGTLVNSLPASTQWYIYSPIAGGAGTGPLTLSGTSGEFILGSSLSSYSGGTILSNPQVAIGADSALGTGTMTFAGGGLRATSSGARTLSNPVTISGGASFYGNGPSNHPDIVLTGPITLSGSTQMVTTTMASGSTFNGLTQFNGSVGDGGAVLGLTKAGSGVLVLGGSNTYSGTTTLAGGTLRLANASALGGGGNVSFTGGTLQYSVSNQADYSAKIVGSSSAIAIDTNGQSVSYASALASSNAGGLTKSGSGTLTLAANNAYTGLTTVSGGTLQIGNGGTTGSITGNMMLSNTSGVVFSRSDSLTYSGSISGTGSFTKTGAGTLTLSGSNAYVGSTTIAGGTLSIATANSLAGSFTLDGGTIVNATGGTSFGKVGGVPAFTVGPGGGAVRSDSRIDPTGVISGTSPTALLTYGPATTGSGGILLVISGNNTYAANTKVEAGMAVVVDNNTAFGTGTLELAGASIRSRQQGGTSPPRSLANAIVFSANTQFDAGASTPNLTFTGSATLSGGTRTFQVDSVLTSGSSAGQPGVIFTNAIGDGGNGFGITKTGAGVLALGGANTYSGATTLSAGTIQLQNQNALQNSTLSLSGSGGVVFDSVVSGNAFTLGGLAASSTSATLALQNSAATAIALAVGGNNASTTYAGSLTGPGSLEKAGTGSLVLSGSNTFAGTTTVTGGTLQIGNGTTGSVAGNVVNNAALLFNRSNSASFSGGISGSGSVTTSGAGTLTLSGSNSYSGPTTLAGGTLAIAGANSLPASGTVTFTGGALQYSGSYTTDVSSRIAGSTGAVAIDTNGQSVTFASSLAATNVGGLFKLGSGTLALSAANAVTGPVTVGGGVLAVGNAAALPASGNVSFTGGTLQYSGAYAADLSARIVGSTAAIAIDTNGQDVAFASAINNTNTAGFTKSGGGTLTLSGSNNYSGTTTVNSGTLAFTTDAAFTLVSGSIALDGATLAYTGTTVTNQSLGQPISLGAGGGTLSNPGAAFWFVGGQISGAGSLTLASGSSLMILQGANTNSGGVSLQAGSQVVVANNSAGPVGAPTSGVFGTGVLTLAGGGLRSTTGAGRTIGNAVVATADTTFFSALTNDDKSITFTGPVSLSGGTRTFTVNTTGTGSPAITFSGGIGDSGNGLGLTKAGPGRMILAGVNTYSGPTVVSAGTLLINGTQAAGSLMVDIGATLGGSGLIGGAVTVNGTLSPGNSPGVLSVASLVLDGSSTSVFEINGLTRGTHYDGVSITGASGPTYGGTLSLDFGNLAAFDNDTTFDLFNFSGSLSGNYSTVTSTGFYAGTWSPVSSGTWKLESGSQTLTFSQSTGDIIVVPEPGALALAGIGIAAAAWAIRRKKV